jgi:hypothetical protein
VAADRPDAASLVQFEHTVGLCPAAIEGDAPAGDARPQAVMVAAACLVLVEPKILPAAQKIA